MTKRTIGRIVYSRTASGFLTLSGDMFAKFQADGDSSPLNLIDGYDWKVDGPKVARCQANHDEAEKLRKKSEELYAARDLDLKDLKAIVKASGKVLKGIHAKNPKKLGDYGLVVDDSPQSAKGKE